MIIIIIRQDNPINELIKLKNDMIIKIEISKKFIILKIFNYFKALLTFKPKPVDFRFFND